MKRYIFSLLIFIISVVLSMVPIGILITILDLYFSGHGIAQTGSDEVWAGMSIANFIFTILTLSGGTLGAIIYWLASRTSDIHINISD